MMKIATAFCFSIILVGAPIHAHAAGAQAPRTWVSGASTASDSNPCTRALPCATFYGAYGATQAGGEIDVLDGGDFGSLVISKAITIASDDAGTGGFTWNGGGGFLIEAAVTDAVVLRGLNLNGIDVGGGFVGVYLSTAGSVLIDHCRIEGFTGPAISVSPIQGGAVPTRLWVTDTILSNDGASNNGAVLILPSNGIAVTARLERVNILGAAGNGIRADSTNVGSPVDVELHDVTVDGASGGSGIVAVTPTSGGPTVKIVADNVTASHNAGYGLRAVGGTASIVLSHSVIEGNAVGIGASSGGSVASYGDNRFANNASGNGVSPTAIPLE